MPELQGGATIHERRSYSAGPVRVAVQGVRSGNYPPLPRSDATRDEGAQTRSVPLTTVPTATVSEETAWLDAQYLVKHGLIYRTANLAIFTWGTKKSPEGKGVVGIYATALYGDTIWHWARCTCGAGEQAGQPCAHKAAAFIVSRNHSTLPVGFPSF